MEPEPNLGWSPLVIVGSSATVVIERGLTGMLRHDIQVALEGVEPVVAFLSTLTANGVHDLPRFAYVGREGSTVRILLRGDAVALARDSSGRETELTAGSVSTWTEVVRTDCVDVALLADGELITVVSYGVPQIEESPTAVTDGDRAAADDPQPEPPPPAPSAEVSVDETIFPEPDVAPESATGPEVDRSPEPADLPTAVMPAVTPPSDDEVDLSHLFETRHVGVEAAAIRADEPGLEVPSAVAPPSGPSLAHLPPPAGAPVPDLSSLAPPSGPPIGGSVERPAPVGSPPVRLGDLPPPAGAPVVAPPPPGLIAGVPGALARDAVADDAGDHDGLTISPSQLAALRGGSVAAGSARPSGPNGPQLQAVSCPSGHLNPPQAERCRACGTGIVDRSIRVVSRPSLGHLSFDGGTVVDIDRPLLIGRKPTAEGIAGGAEMPGLVVLPDPDGSLSRVHAEVRIEGWEVLVVDRNSTNGTFVEIPGQPPVLLRPMESCLISPGTRITFADVATCAFQTGPR